MQYLGHVGTFLRLNVEFLSEIGTSSNKILIAWFRLKLDLFQDRHILGSSTITTIIRNLRIYAFFDKKEFMIFFINNIFS